MGRDARDLIRITPAMCGAGRSLAHVLPSPDGTLIAYIVSGGGRPRIVTVAMAGGPEITVTSDPPCAGAHPHGGGVYDWCPDSSGIVYAGSDGALYRVPVDGGPGELVFASQSASSPAVSPDGASVAFTVEDRTVMVCALGSGGGEGRAVVVSGGTRAATGPGGSGSGDPDFVMDPVWDRDGTRVTWTEWDVPHMPWDESRIATAPRDASAPARVLAGGSGISVGQPRYSPDGRMLAFVSDESGWPVVWVATADGEHAEPLVRDSAEHCEPAWGAGQRSYAWSPDAREIAIARNRGGYWLLNTVRAPLSVSPDGWEDHRSSASTGRSDRVVEWRQGFFASLGWNLAGKQEWGRIIGLHSNFLSPARVVVLDVGPVEKPAELLAHAGEKHRSNDGRRYFVAQGPVGGFEGLDLPAPEPVSWPMPGVSGSEVYGRIYRPGGARGEPGPLIVWIHGGPTGQMGVEFSARLVYLLSAGWSVLVPDFRGSTGWGRAYTQALRGGWGDTDVDDVAAGMRHAGAQGWADTGAMVPMGASSGGMAVLLLLARHPDLCAGGIDLYGVTDLADLAASTHRFEAHYTESMVGPLPDAKALYDERSPISWAGSIRAPLLVLHGDADKVVPVAQSDALVEKIRAAGGRVGYHVYEGEGHGWSDPSVVADELERITTFLDSLTF